MLNEKGKIPLYDSHAIGLLLDKGSIGLHRIGNQGWSLGIRINVDLRHYRAQGETSAFMTLDRLELSIPGQFGIYTARMSGWKSFKVSGWIEYFKPEECVLLPNHYEFTTFAFLDAWDEEDPYFYFGWSQRSDMMPPFGYRRRATVAYLGVNYPVQDFLRPGWENVPSQSQLLTMLKPWAPFGTWHLKANISSFMVDGEVAQESYSLIRAVEGWRRWHKDVLDFVKTGDRVVGVWDVDWESISWGSTLDPGQLIMRSGAAKGRIFRVVGTSFTGWAPQPGYPPNTWLIYTHPSDPIPSQLGVKAGDAFEIAGPYDYHVFTLAEYYKVHEAGFHNAEELKFQFSPI